MSLILPSGICSLDEGGQLIITIRVAEQSQLCAKHAMAARGAWIGASRVGGRLGGPVELGLWRLRAP